MNSEQHRKCQQWMDSALKDSPSVVFMLEQLEKVGCKFSTSNFKCIPCVERFTGGFAPDYGIFLSENRISSFKETSDTLTHQMIKAFDHCTTKINWSSSQHYACSEIRATNLSGECKFDRELMRGNIGVMKHHQACVRRRVLAKMKRLAEFKEGDVAQDSIDAVFDICFKDTAPFDEIY